MKTFTRVLLQFSIVAISFITQGQIAYFPERNTDWEERSALSFNIDLNQLSNVVDFAEANEYSGSRDLRIAILKGFEREPFHEILGPTKKRGGPAGMILKDGYIIAK